MGSFKFTKPRAPGGVCWHCDRRLHAGGRSYETVVVDGHKRPMHMACAEAAIANGEASAVDLAAELKASLTAEPARERDDDGK